MVDNMPSSTREIRKTYVLWNSWLTFNSYENYENSLVSQDEKSNHSTDRKHSRTLSQCHWSV